MSHYDEEYEKAIQEASVNIRNEHKDGSIHINTVEEADDYINSLKSAHIVGHITEKDLLDSIDEYKAHADLITDPWNPMYNAPEPNIVDSLNPWYNRLEEMESTPLKETKGKAHDARYCYLYDIAKVVFDHENSDISQKYIDIGEMLAIIVESVEDNNVANAEYYCSEILNNLINERTLHELVGVRAHALSSGKYTLDGYRGEIDVKLLLDAAARHFLKILFVDKTDEESGFSHDAHIAANVIMVHTQLRLHHERD
jgi:hypothetical protein